jgi:hypothetical protein
MFRSKTLQIRVSIAKKALEAIFDECDRFDMDETGGRIIGDYRKKDLRYDIEVRGVIGPGPNAKRTATSFFQDGDYQEKVFRSVEQSHPDIEHLGNWHTHHVNGLSTLSSGDKATYQNIVNHDQHNTDFFYAILVVRKTPGRNQRYDVKHYFFRRDDRAVYEIPDYEVQIVDTPILSPLLSEGTVSAPTPSRQYDVLGYANQERVRDQEFFSEFFPAFRPLLSKSTGTFYWKGKLDLIDGRAIDVLAMEIAGTSSYSVTVSGQKIPTLDTIANYRDRAFKSARQAVMDLERDMNQEMYRKK